MTNKNFGKFEDGVMVYAQDYLVRPNGGIVMHTSAEQYREAGYLPVEQTLPNPPKGYHAKSYVWREYEDKIVRVWEYEEDAPIVRQFSKLKLYGAIAQLGAWDAVKTWLEQKTINGINGWMAFQLAQEISEAHPLFAPLADEIRNILKLDARQFDTLLNSCILEG